MKKMHWLRKCSKFMALLMACLLLFGSVVASAEADVDEAEDVDEYVEEEEDTDVYIDEDEEATWETTEFGGIRFGYSSDWDVFYDGSAMMTVEFDDAYISCMPFDPEGEDVLGIGMDAPTLENYMDYFLGLLLDLEPAHMDPYEYNLNGIEFELYYADDISWTEYEDEEATLVDAVYIVYRSEAASGQIFVEISNEDLTENKVDLLRMLFSIALVEDEEPVEEDDAEAVEDAEADMEDAVEEVAEEGAEAVEEIAEEAQAEEEAPEEEEEAPEEEEAYEDEEDEDFNPDEAGPDMIFWIDKNSGKSLYRVPDTWEESGYDGEYGYSINDYSEVNVSSMDIAEIESEVSSKEEYFEIFEEQYFAILGEIGDITFASFDPFVINGMDARCYYLCMDVMGVAVDNILLLTYGEEVAGMTAVTYVPGDEVDDFASMVIGFLTSFSESVEE